MREKTEENRGRVCTESQTSGKANARFKDAIHPRGSTLASRESTGSGSAIDRPGTRLIGSGRTLSSLRAGTRALALMYARAETMRYPTQRPARAPAAISPAPQPASSLPTASVASQEHWLVDGYNVLHAGLLGPGDRGEWWRAKHRARLAERCAPLGRQGAGSEQAARVWLVFDGQHPLNSGDTIGSENPTVVFAPSADDWIVKYVRESDDVARLIVVTGDRQVADRCRHAGARVVAPREFLRRCDEATAVSPRNAP
jgi:predicted RNA-binding protein with PIN domain